MDMEKRNTEKYKKKKKNQMSFSAVCYSVAWMQSDITAENKKISEATHIIGTNTVNIHIESN